jgi:hypothetical protein
LLFLPPVMSEPRGLRCSEIVGRSYESVRELLTREPLKLLQRATASALGHSNSLIVKLRLDVARVEVGVDIRVLVRRIRDQPLAAGRSPELCVELLWEAMRMPTLFPTMLAEVFARPASNRTRLELSGSYWLPLGNFGKAVDVAVGHRIAESVIRRLLSDFAKQLESELAGEGVDPAARS